jgi:hypothetical protein
VALSMPSVTARAVEPTPRTVYVSVVDGKGVAIGDLTAADFSVKENGKDYPLTKAELAQGPMQVAIVVDDNGTGAFRQGVAALARVTEFTSNVETLRTGITSLVARPGAQDGNYAVDAALEALKDLEKKKATRPVLVMFTVGAGDKSLSSSAEVLRSLKQTMASLHVLALGNAMVSAAAGGMDQINLQQVLDDGPKQSGGKRHSLTAVPQVAEGVQRVLDHLTKQYALSYMLPDGVKKHERLQVAVKRSGATVMAPAKISDR